MLINLKAINEILQHSTSVKHLKWNHEKDVYSDRSVQEEIEKRSPLWRMHHSSFVHGMLYFHPPSLPTREAAHAQTKQPKGKKNWVKASAGTSLQNSYYKFIRRMPSKQFLDSVYFSFFFLVVMTISPTHQWMTLWF